MSQVRMVVLDIEAVQALLDPGHRRHRRAVAVVQAGVGRNLRRRRSVRLAVPTAVRVEAGWDRRDRGAAAINRLGADDIALDGPAADHAAAIRTALNVSVADAHVGAALSAPEPVAVVTSDVDDIRRIAAHLDLTVNIVAL